MFDKSDHENCNTWKIIHAINGAMRKSQTKLMLCGAWWTGISSCVFVFAHFKLFRGKVLTSGSGVLRTIVKQWCGDGA